MFGNCKHAIRIKLYKKNHLVKPIPDYCCSVWNPYLRDDIKALEKIQKGQPELINVIKAVILHGNVEHTKLNTFTLSKNMLKFNNVV